VIGRGFATLIDLPVVIGGPAGFRVSIRTSASFARLSTVKPIPACAQRTAILTASWSPTAHGAVLVGAGLR